MIREKFGFERWMIVGGSWGATLALAYAQAHPDRVSGIVLRATFLGTRAELEGAFLDALPRFYPDAVTTISSACCRRKSALSRSTPTGAASSIPIPACMARPRAPGTIPSASCRNMRRDASGLISHRIELIARPARHAVHGSALFRQ